MEDNNFYEIEDDLKQECIEIYDPWSVIVINGVQYDVDSKYVPGMKIIDLNI